MSRVIKNQSSANTQHFILWHFSTELCVSFPHNWIWALSSESVCCAAAESPQLHSSLHADLFTHKAVSFFANTKPWINNSLTRIRLFIESNLNLYTYMLFGWWPMGPSYPPFPVSFYGLHDKNTVTNNRATKVLYYFLKILSLQQINHMPWEEKLLNGDLSTHGDLNSSDCWL